MVSERGDFRQHLRHFVNQLARDGYDCTRPVDLVSAEAARLHEEDMAALRDAYAEESRLHKATIAEREDWRRAARLKDETIELLADQKAALREELDERTRQRNRIESERQNAEHRLTGLRERVAKLEEALKPFARFAEKWDAQPLANYDDRIYGIHVGTEWEAELRLSACRAARVALSLNQQEGA